MQEIRNSFREGAAGALGVLIVAIVDSDVVLEPKYRIGSSRKHSYILVDGQHRLNAYLYASTVLVKNAIVAVETIVVKTIEEAMKLYALHYENLEAPPEHRIAGASKEWPTNVLTPLLDAIGEKWHMAGGTSIMLLRGARAPQFNRPEVENALSDYLKEHRKTYQSLSWEELLVIVDNKNNAIAKDPPISRPSGNIKLAPSTFDKANKAKCWLGLVSASTWLV